MMTKQTEGEIQSLQGIWKLNLNQINTDCYNKYRQHYLMVNIFPGSLEAAIPCKFIEYMFHLMYFTKASTSLVCRAGKHQGLFTKWSMFYYMIVPFCLNPKMRSTHSCRWADTCFDSKACNINRKYIQQKMCAGVSQVYQFIVWMSKKIHWHIVRN